METQIKRMYKITALTNLHVGSGDQNFGIIDKLVQRDPVTQFPVIHASSLKGALKVYCREVLNMDEKIDPMLNSFGSNDNQGKDKFFSAHLLTIPVRSNTQPYYRATCPTILKEITEMMQMLGFPETNKVLKAFKELKDVTLEMKKKFFVFKKLEPDTIIEEHDLTNKSEYDVYEKINYKKIDIKEIKKNLNLELSNFVIIRDDIFMDICNNLPVVARNRIENGKNLWYEELVPRQSEFYFFYLGNTADNEKKIMEAIVDNSTSIMPIQIGANASVGYGYCKIEKIQEP